jgi:hypothetical protein
MEGLDHTSTFSVLSKSMGGVTLALKNDVSLMFDNPASLSTLDRLTVSVGSSQAMTRANQAQQWYPLFSFGSFSTLMDGSTRGIVPTGTALTSADTNWVPFDNLGPNWTHDNNSEIVPNIFVGMPIQLNNLKMSVGLGYVEYANMNYFYQNNNDLSPEYDLVIIGNPADPTDSLKRLDWFQSIHGRTGSLHSIGGALSIDIKENYSLGISGKYISGSTDDADINVGRGVIWFFSSGKAQRLWPSVPSAGSCIRVDSAVYSKTVSGTSDFSGFELNIGTQFRAKNVTIGASIVLPTTITREFSGRVVSDTTKRALFAQSNYQNDTTFTEKMRLPIRAKIGASFQLRSNVLMALEFEYLPYASAELEKNGTKTKPWLDDRTSFHAGICWDPIDKVSLRFGYRKQKEVFAAQYPAYKNDPVSYNAYSLGVGAKILPYLSLNASYEYYQVKYEDVWAQSYNINTKNVNNLSAQLVYTLP